MDDKYARLLIPRAERISIYRRLNPCNVAITDNCPAAAAALFSYLSNNDGAFTRAICNEAGRGFIYGNGVRFRSASLQSIVQLVQRGQPGNHVVVHGVRPAGARVNGVHMARDHYFSLVKLGPPEDDVFWADCSRPDFSMFFPSSQRTHGNWTNTIDGMARLNRLRGFEYTRGPYTVRLEP